MGEFRACDVRGTLGTCPVFAKPVGTNFARSRRFLPKLKTLIKTAISRQLCLETPVEWRVLQKWNVYSSGTF
jgi:hypothetical protein